MKSEKFWKHCAKDQIIAYSDNHEKEEYSITYEELYQHFAERFRRENVGVTPELLEVVDLRESGSGP